MIDHISHAYIYIHVIYIYIYIYHYIIDNLPTVHILRTIIINKSHTISYDIYSDRYTHPILIPFFPLGGSSHVVGVTLVSKSFVAPLPMEWMNSSY